MVDVFNLDKYLNNYVFDTVLPGSGEKVSIRPYSAVDLKNLLMAAEDDESALDDILKSCITTEGFNVDDLYIQDRQYLLVELRKITKGTTYSFTRTCPECNSVQPNQLDLKKLKLKKLSKLNKVLELDDNIKLELTPIKRGAIKKASELINDESLTPEARLVSRAMITYALCITKIITPEGEYSPTSEDAINFITNPKLPRWMFDKISEWFNNLEFGYEPLILKYACTYEKCPKFGDIKEEVLDVGDFLF